MVGALMKSTGGDVGHRKKKTVKKWKILCVLGGGAIYI